MHLWQTPVRHAQRVLMSQASANSRTLLFWLSNGTEMLLRTNVAIAQIGVALAVGGGRWTDMSRQPGVERRRCTEELGVDAGHVNTKVCERLLHVAHEGSWTADVSAGVGWDAELPQFVLREAAGRGVRKAVSRSAGGIEHVLVRVRKRRQQGMSLDGNAYSLGLWAPCSHQMSRPLRCAASS
jgi:hypothetical protein